MIAALITAWKAVMAALKGFKLLKYVSPGIAALSLLKGYILKYWKLTAIIVLSCMLVGVNWLKNREIRNLEAEKVVLQAASQDYARTLDANERAFNHCIDVNRENIRNHMAAQLTADNAVMRLQNELRRRDNEVEKVDEDVQEFRGKDEDCRSLDDPLPEWFDDWLRE